MNTMKKVGAVVLAALLAGGAGAHTMAYWDFSSDPTGMLDCSGNGNTLTNAGVRLVEGAAYLNGDEVELFRTISNLQFLEVGEYTIEFFAKSLTTDISQCLIELSPNVGVCRGSFFFYFNDGFMARGTGSEASGWNGEKFLNSPVGDGQWHHYAGIIHPWGEENAAEQVQFYVDGVRQEHYSDYQASHIKLYPNYQLFIGSREDKEHKFTGYIDDIRITRGALSTNDFLKVRSTNEALKVVAYYPFDSANPYADASGNDHALEGSGGMFTNNIASFDGAGHALKTITTLDLSGYDALTIEYFVHFHPGNDVDQMVFEFGKAGWVDGSFFSTLNERPTAGGISGTFYKGSHQWHIDQSSVSQAWGWHHVAMVYDKSMSGDDQCRLFIDGWPQRQVVGYNGDMTQGFGNHYLYIGSRENNSVFLDADIDDLRITAQALEPGQFLQRSSHAHDDTIAYWDFDPKHDALLDRGPYGHRLLMDGVTITPEQTALLDGNQLRFKSENGLSLWEAESFTVEFFMRSTHSDRPMMLLELSYNCNYEGGTFMLLLNDYGPGLVGGGFNLLSVDVNCYALQCVDSVNCADGRWHHVALVYDKAAVYTNPVRLYVDGRLGTVANPAHDSRREMKLNSSDWYIGSRGDAQIKYQGELDDIRITARALSPSEFLQRRSGPKGMLIIIK